ncbi:MAG: hypothetical protein ABIP92_02945 [Arthrobacter sp.]
MCFLTGLFSHGLQNPPSWMLFPTSPVWIYQLTQGIHVTAGIASIPLLLAKLWSVYLELLTWPPVKSVAHGLERASIALFIASSLLQLTTGLINTYKWYPRPFPFRETHRRVGMCASCSSGTRSRVVRGSAAAAMAIHDLWQAGSLQGDR